MAFYDPVNNPSLTNGTEVFPYDDQGHGSHCAGTTAGTGAPTYENPGMAPQAKLVGVKVLDSGGSGSFAVVMAGMQWTIDNRYQFFNHCLVAFNFVFILLHGCDHVSVQVSHATLHLLILDISSSYHHHLDLFFFLYLLLRKNSLQLIELVFEHHLINRLHLF